MNHSVLHLKDYFSFLGNDGCDPTVEMYLPYNMVEMRRGDRKRPCMIVCPGGGYAMCSQRESEPIALQFLPDGFNVFVITYSVAPHRFPTQLREVAALMELIYRNAEEWNCDTSKIAIIGFSAGGHLAAHYSTMYDCKEVREVFPKSKPVNASVLCYPVITAGEKAHRGSFVNLCGSDSPTKQQLDYYSLEKHVDAESSPAFIIHTAADTLVPVENSLLMAEAYAKAGVTFELHVYPYGPHGLALANEITSENKSELVNSQYARWVKDSDIFLKSLLHSSPITH